MKTLKKNFGTLLSLALVFTVALMSDAMADSSVFSVGAGKAINLFKSIRTIAFVLGGFGLVGLAFSAIFGKIKWTWFGAMAVGLCVLAAAGAIVNYATGDEVTKSYGDTFGSAGTGSL